MADSKELRPLMLAIDDVLKALGDPGSLEPPLRQKASRLQEAYTEYEECCCFFAHVIPFSERRPTQAPKPPKKAKKAAKPKKVAKAKKAAKKKR